MEELNKKYTDLCLQLGDLNFKKMKLELVIGKILSEMKELDNQSKILQQHKEDKKDGE